MKALIKTNRPLTNPSYEKLYLSFNGPHGTLERNILKILPQKTMYLGGREPKMSLFLGTFEEEIVTKIELTRDERNKQYLESHPETCRCGMRFKDEKKANVHYKVCSVIKGLEDRFRRIAIAIGADKDAKSSSRKKKKDDSAEASGSTQHHRSNRRRRRKAAAKAKKKMARRRRSSR